MELNYNLSCYPKGWKNFFFQEDVIQMVKNISDRLQYDSQVQKLGINPKIGWVFRALNMVPLDQVKAIIMGQDPAPQPGLATGLAFSLDKSVHPTEVPSVQRVILEARNEGYCVDPEKGVLISWAEQGVVLLNTALTLIQDEIGSHIDVWANFTDNLIKYINENASPSVWILWGWNAKQLEDKIDHSKHYVLKGGHPSPNADGKYFFCQNYFSCAIDWLCRENRGMIDWNLVSLPCQKHTSQNYVRVTGYPGFTYGQPCLMQACPAFKK